MWRAATDGPGWPATLRLLVAGLLTGGLLVLNLSLIPLLLFAGLLVLLAWYPGSDRSLRRHMLWSLAVGVQLGFGLLIVAGVYAYWIGHSPLQAFLVALATRHGLIRDPRGPICCFGGFEALLLNVRSILT